MVRHIKKVMLGLAALASIAFGAATIAQAGSKHHHAVKAHRAQSAADNETQGEQQDQPGDTGGSAERQDQPGDSSGSAEQQDQPGDSSGSAEQQDQPGDTADSGSEQPNNDGPGGHADEPGNPNANHEFQGNE